MEHTTVRFDIFVLIALVILVAVIVYFIVMHSKRKRKQKELEEQIENMYGDGSSTGGTPAQG